MPPFPEPTYWLALLSAEGLGRTLAKRIIARWCMVEGQPLAELYALEAKELQERLGLAPLEVGNVLVAWESLPRHRAALDELVGAGIQLVIRSDVAYPETLVARLNEARLPYLLYARGDLALLTEGSVALLGTSQPTEEAAQAALALALALGEDDLTLVGGYDKGIDRLAIEAVRSGGGRAALVLPMGLAEFATPLRGMEEDIAAGRLLVLSPYAPETPFELSRAQARLSLVTALADVLALISPERSPAEQPALAEALSAGRLLLVGGEGELAHSWVAAGAHPCGDVAAARALCAELMGQGIAAPGPAAVSYDAAATEAPPIAFTDATSAIETLGQLGAVPDVLAKRLRERL